DGARGYFIHAMASQGDTIVMWSSSEDGYAGPELMDYLPEALLAQWTGKRTVLGADARSCRIPAEVFAGVEAAPVVQMIAYGGQRSIAEPRPADAGRDWSPAWTVRVRSKSTAMLMPGLAAGATRDAARPAAKETARGLLRGLLGNSRVAPRRQKKTPPRGGVFRVAVTRSALDQKSMPPMPPMPPPAAAGSSFFGSSATIASVVIIRPAIDAAFCSAVRVTLVGSRMPNSTMSPNWPL